MVERTRTKPTGFALVLFNDVGDEMELGVHDPLGEERHEAASQPHSDTQREGQRTPDELSVAFRSFRPAAVVVCCILFVCMPHLEGVGKYGQRS